MQGGVAVIGGGTAGLILAKDLALNGIDVDVYEAHGEIGYGAEKASGILSIEGLSQLGINYKEAVVNTLYGATIYGQREKMLIKAKRKMAYILDRKKLAMICAKEAEGAGARINLNAKIGKERLEQLRSEKIIVGADGPVSNVASFFSFPKMDSYILTYKAEFSGASIPDKECVELFFSNISKKFFGWTAPYSDSVLEVGIGEWMKTRRNSYSVFSEFLKTKTITEEVGNASKRSGLASLIPFNVRKRTVKGNVILVGDSAGQVKSTTGGGIIFGGLCAKMAADVITQHIRFGRPLSDYEKLWRRKYGMDLGLHKILHSYYSRIGGRGMDLMIKFSKVFGIDSFLGEYGDMDRPSVVIKRLFIK